MKEIQTKRIIDVIKNLCMSANYDLPDDVKTSLVDCIEADPIAKNIICQLNKNHEIAKNEKIPLCQDTGAAIFFIEIGQEVHIAGNLTEAVNEGVRLGYKEGFLRKSIVSDPLRRKNTGDNTPAFIHTDIVPGNDLKITFCPKGGGAENMSRIAMLIPADGWKGIKKFVIDTVKLAGANPCPPIIAGIGIGGTFDYAPLLAKKAILRNLDDTNPDPFYAEKEIELLTAINQLNIGPAGFGGQTTALGVKINTSPCHIASMPVAINIQCHSARKKTVIL